MCVQNLKFVALPIPEIIGGTPKTGQSLDTPTLPFLQLFFHGLLFGWTLWMYWPNLHFVALPFPGIIAIAVWGWGCEPSSLGEGEAVSRVGMVPFERGLVSSYRPFIVIFRLSLRVSEILPLLCSSTPLFPVPRLVFPKFPHVPLRIGWWPLEYEERRCWANCPCN